MTPIDIDMPTSGLLAVERKSPFVLTVFRFE